MYEYRLTPSAKKDLLEIRSYIQYELFAEDSAYALMEAFEAAFIDACHAPLSLPPAHDPHLSARGYHKIIVKNYVALVLIDEEDECIDVMRVVYQRRNYSELL